MRRLSPDILFDSEHLSRDLAGRLVSVMPDTTKHPAAVEVGTGKLVGTDRAAIMDVMAQMLSNKPSCVRECPTR